MCRFCLVAIVASLTILLSVSDSYGSTVLDPGCSVAVTVYDGTIPTTVAYTPTTLPYELIGHVAASGGNNGNASYLLNDDQFTINFTNTRASLYRSASMITGTLNFHVDVNTDYFLSGSYSVVDPSGRMISAYLSLREEMGGVLFENLQQSDHTPNENFMLGLEEGDLANALSGSLMGTLAADTVYVLTYEYYIEAIPTAAFEAATAEGSINLDFGMAQVVPLPGAVWAGLVLLGVFGGAKVFHRHLSA